MKRGAKTRGSVPKELKQLPGSQMDLKQARAELERAPAVLRNSEESYKMLVEQSLQGFAIAQDIPPHLVFANPVMAEILGYSVEELLGLSPEAIKALVHPEDQAVFFQRYQARLSGKPVPQRYDIRAIRRDGTVRWVEIFSNRIEYRGKPAVQAVFVDVTERKRAQEALQESEAQSRAILNVIPDLIFRIDKNGTFLSYKAPKEELYLPPEKFLGKNLSAVLPDQLAERTIRFIRRALKTDQMQVFDYNLQVNGDLRYYEARVVASGEDEVLTIVRDITERKRAEGALRGSEKRYRTLTDNVNVGVYRNTTGPKGKFIEANPAIVKMFGFQSREEFLAVDVADLYQNPEDRRKFNEKMLRDGFVKNEELQLKRKDGTAFIGSVSAVAIKGEEGQVGYYDGVIEDITERKRVEEELKQSFERLQELFKQTVDVLASAVEMRDPYTAGHQRRVTILACAIGEELGLSQKQMDGLRMAALIHDMGKIYVPAEILSKPGRLTETEFNLIKIHPQVGYDLLKTIVFPWPVAQIVLQHHERMDGSGFPQGLSGEEILLEARILAVADVVEAMSSHRPYRPAQSETATLEEISKNRGRLYDPQAVDACLRLFTEKGFKFA